MYGGAPHGPHYTFTHHRADELLPVLEIEKCLERLDEGSKSASLVSLFWEIKDHSDTSKPTPPAQAGAASKKDG
jgi:hypothetical protein